MKVTSMYMNRRYLLVNTLSFIRRKWHTSIRRVEGEKPLVKQAMVALQIFSDPPYTPDSGRPVRAGKPYIPSP